MPDNDDKNTTDKLPANSTNQDIQETIDNPPQSLPLQEGDNPHDPNYNLNTGSIPEDYKIHPDDLNLILDIIADLRYANQNAFNDALLQFTMFAINPEARERMRPSLKERRVLHNNRNTLNTDPQHHPRLQELLDTMRLIYKIPEETTHSIYKNGRSKTPN